MCINNAANYEQKVFEQSGEVLDDAEWARRVHSRASALYVLGDLKNDPVAEENETTVQALFS
jgi:hypothetical protein